MLINKREKFDKLAQKYDLYRPRYPKEFLKEIFHWSKNNKKKKLNILDVGSGTGIVLEKLINIFGKKNNFYSIDISYEMIKLGKKKFPFVNWIKGKAEEKINLLPNMDIFIFAQSYQWMNRNLILNLIKKKINKKGLFCILQNNRNYKINNFLNEYENILESININYNRKYRNIKYNKEINFFFKKKINLYIYMNKYWDIYLSKKEFLGMINSSTQVENVKNINKKLFYKNINFLLKRYLCKKKLLISYKTELFIFRL